MGEWPTIFDKSTTLTLGDGRRFFVASPLGLGEIGLKIANHQTKSMIDGLCCAVEGRQDKNIMKMSQLLRLSGGMGAAALNNQNLPRKVGEHIRMGNLIALPLPPMTLLPLAGSLGMARSLAPTMINLPSLEGIDPNNPDVRTMDETQRMLWVLLKCGEILDQTGKSEVAAAFKQLLEPEVIGLVVAGLIVWGASHFVGVGFIFDIAMVVVIGVAVLKAFETMWEIYKIITKASSKTDLDRAAKMMADMVIAIGVETFLAIVLKGAAKSRFRAPPSKATGTVDEAVEMAPSRGRGAAKKPSEEAPKKKADEEAAAKKKSHLITARKKTAYDFYKKQGWSDTKIQSHMNGIDFNHPVEVVQLKDGVVLGQWQSPGAPKGNYFAPINDKPSQLGIGSVGHNRATGNAESKIQKLYKLNGKTEALSSKAASIADNWSSPYATAMTKGGGQQYFVPDPAVFKGHP